MTELRTNQITKTEVIAVIGGFIIAFAEAYARIEKKEIKKTLNFHPSISNKYPRHTKS